jgi:hypothetical protein
MKKDTPMDRLDPARTALVVVHMVKGVAGEVDTPSTEFSGAAGCGERAHARLLLRR